MIDALILPTQRRALAPVAAWLDSRDIRADQLTLVGFGFGLAGFAAVIMDWWLPALAMIGMNRLMDGLDGAVARLQGPTDRGAFLDIALDFMFYALIPLGFALNDPVNALPAAVLIAAFVGTGSSFLAFAAIAAKRGDSAAAFPAKGIYYLGGLTEGFETIALFVVICLWPTAFAPLAYVFAAACAITTLLRWHMGWRAFAPNDTERR
ncbi:CDP-alcohol phosphatidyltransferase family protein [Paracoccus sediminilitoris]|uniref:CDP-alcohol phosphatidyltransferase family protein n=1 Tax=Paracoccus sediminilitoris TaxID=2202419 RepID=UPI00272C283F|nr:CDP-alcohol phosphatidyltransferase family protein [Paracoccus sediminilitoris]